MQRLITTFFWGCWTIGRSYCLKLTCRVTLCATSGKFATGDTLVESIYMLWFVLQSQAGNAAIGHQTVLVISMSLFSGCSEIPNILDFNSFRLISTTQSPSSLPIWCLDLESLWFFFFTVGLETLRYQEYFRRIPYFPFQDSLVNLSRDH